MYLVVNAVLPRFPPRVTYAAKGIEVILVVPLHQALTMFTQSVDVEGTQRCRVCAMICTLLSSSRSRANREYGFIPLLSKPHKPPSIKFRCYALPPRMHASLLLQPLSPARILAASQPNQRSAARQSDCSWRLFLPPTSPDSATTPGSSPPDANRLQLQGPVRTKWDACLSLTRAHKLIETQYK